MLGDIPLRFELGLFLRCAAEAISVVCCDLLVMSLLLTLFSLYARSLRLLPAFARLLPER
jgi:hypothetical protein